MVKSDLTLSFLFPIDVCHIKFVTMKTRKPSGIARIILELVKSYHSFDEKLSDTLLRFGVPSELHYIFARELSDICKTGILTFRDIAQFSPNDFERCYIGDFSFSEFGLNVYKKGYITTNEERVSDIDVFYDRIKNKITPAGKTVPITNTVYSSVEFEELSDDQFDFASLLEEYRAKLGLRKEETLKNGSLDEWHTELIKVENAVTLSFSDDSLYVNFAYEKYRDFLKEYLNADMFSNMLLQKLEFKKDKAFPSNLPIINCIPDIGGIAMLFPVGKANTLWSMCAGVVFDKGVYSVPKKTIKGRVVCDSMFNEAIDELCHESALVWVDNCKVNLAIVANFRYRNNVFSDDITLPMVIVVECNSDKSEQFLKEICDRIYSEDYSANNASLILDLSKAFHDKSPQKTYISKLLEADMIDEALKMIDSKESDKSVLELFSTYFENKCTQITPEQIFDAHSEYNSLRKRIGVNDVKYIQMLVSGINNKSELEHLYFVFEKLKYQPNVILPSINVVDFYMNQLLSGKIEVRYENSLSDRFKALSEHFNRLKQISGVDSHIAYSVKEQLDENAFSELFKSFSNEYNKVNKYSMYSSDSFRVLGEFWEIFGGIDEVIALEKAARKNIGDISHKYIMSCINKSDFRTAVCDMYIRLEAELQEYYENTDLPVYNMLDLFLEENTDSKDVVDKMHKLRLVRNGMFHAKGKKVEYTRLDLEEWCNALFEFIGGLKDEQNSED